MHKETIGKIIQIFKHNIQQKYLCFSGRTGQTEYWLYVLVYSIAGLILRLIPVAGGLLYLIWSLVVLLPTIGITVRRLHDRNHSGWICLLGLIPVVGPLALLLFLIPAGSPSKNTYGEIPAEPAVVDNSNTLQIIIVISIILCLTSMAKSLYCSRCPLNTCPAEGSPSSSVRTASRYC